MLQRIEENEAVGALEGDISALDLLTRLLSVLAYVHGRGFVHRDIKDANIISLFPDRVVTLIDFGFCKRVNERSLRSDDSFWRAGAPRFSPPTKLSHPSLALPSHDVFAVLRTIEAQEGARVSDDLRLIARLYALTHDVTHIPYGHTLEDEFGFFPRHDHHRIDSSIFRQFRLQPQPRSEDRRLVSVVGGKYGLRVDREFALEDLLEAVTRCS